MRAPRNYESFGCTASGGMCALRGPVRLRLREEREGRVVLSDLSLFSAYLLYVCSLTTPLPRTNRTNRRTPAHTRTDPPPKVSSVQPVISLASEHYVGGT